MVGHFFGREVAVAWETGAQTPGHGKSFTPKICLKMIILHDGYLSQG